MSVDIVRSHLRNGDYTLAEVAARNALEEPLDSSRSSLLALLARAQYRLGLPREALRSAEAAHALQPDTDSTVALAEALLANGDPARAAAMFQQLADALEQGELTDVTDRWELVHNLAIDLAESLRAAGNAESALSHAHRAVAIAEQRFGPNAPECAEAWLTLGQCQRVLQQPLRAKHSLTQALDLRRTHTPTHPDVAHTLDAIGLLERAQNRPQAAVQHHRAALDVWASQGQSAGTDSATRQMLAQALHRTGDFAGARTEMERAWKATHARFGADHVDTWIAAFELGRFRMDCGEVQEGLYAMEAARARTRDRLGPEHPSVRAMNRWL
jgi:tetratricopeptide (TPR) repeat protein